MADQDKSNSHQDLVTILMSTYNGAKGLSRQIDSILNQSYKNIKLMVRDDGSADATLEILKVYKKNHPYKIVLIIDDLGNLGSTRSFAELLGRLNSSSYVMFADQDDLWFPNKVFLFITHLKKLESENTTGTPALVFGDMIVTDSQLNVVSESLWQLQKIIPSLIYNWKKVLSQNVVTGCSLMMNYPAKLLCSEIPNIKMIHDHYVAINISKYGVVDFMMEPTMYYIQHSSNVVGASSYNSKFITDRVKAMKSTWVAYYDLCEHFHMNYIQFIYYKIVIGVRRIFTKFL